MAVAKMDNTDNRTVFAFSGFSGSGKTTLIEKLIPVFKRRGYRVAVIKHDAHDFEIDKEGKDTYRFREAGADRVYISSSQKSARMNSGTTGTTSISHGNGFVWNNVVSDTWNSAKISDTATAASLR